MPYEVDTTDGRCLYRGDDLELACEIHDTVPSAHLVFLPPLRVVTRCTGDRRRPVPWKGPANTPHKAA
jgi:hypothetical protein